MKFVLVAVLWISLIGCSQTKESDRDFTDSNEPKADIDGDIGLHDAVRSGDLETVRQVLGKNPKSVNTCSHSFHTPLGVAAIFGHRDIAGVLLDSGADIDAESGGVPSTPLYWAAVSGMKDVVELLVARGASVEKGCGPDSPLVGAILNGRPEIAMLLVAKGARVTIHLSAALGDEKAVSEFLNGGGDVDLHENVRGWTMLHYAAFCGQRKMASTLLTNGADFTIKDREGKSALQWAETQGHGELVQLLKALVPPQ